MGTLYLHIGTPKTGTTAIQRFLMGNRKQLKKEGFFFPDFEKVYPGVGAHRNGYFMSKLPDRYMGEDVEAGYKKLEKIAKKHDRIIISEESIWMKRKKGYWKDIGDRISAMGLKLHVIVYLRRQDTLIESYWNQRVKGPSRLNMTFSEFMKEEYHRLPLRYGKRLDIIEKDAKPEKITVRVFERGQMIGGNPIEDFCSVIGFPYEKGIRNEEQGVNVSFDMDIIEIIRRMNTNTDIGKDNDLYQKAVIKAYGEELGTSNEKPFSDEERNEFLEKYAPDNSHVAKKYLNRDDGVLFYEALRPAKKWSGDIDRLLSAAVRMFSGADILMYKRLCALEEQIDSIYSALPSFIKKRMV